MLLSTDSLPILNETFILCRLSNGCQLVPSGLLGDQKSPEWVPKLFVKIAQDHPLELPLPSSKVYL